MATCYPNYELPSNSSTRQQQVNNSVSVQPQKDYTRPLHVDCSVEYELPNQAKPPAGVRNEPLLMIHPCYFRKIESQRRSPFVNNLPTNTRSSLPMNSMTSMSSMSSMAASTQAVVPQSATAKRRLVRGQQLPQQVPQQAAQYPVQYTPERQIWDPMPPMIPTATTQSYCKQREHMIPSYNTPPDTNHWTEPERSPDRPEEKHILTGKYRQYLRAHRLHPYVTSAIPIASTFPQMQQMQQVCYNV